MLDRRPRPFDQHRRMFENAFFDGSDGFGHHLVGQAGFEMSEDAAQPLGGRERAILAAPYLLV